MDISIVIPFYKGNKYIKKLLNLIQLNRKNLCLENISSEIIIVNDSPEIPVLIDDEHLLNGVRIIDNPYNQGIHQSRVNGLNAAEGKYVLFLDQDDLISNNALLSQMKAIRAYDFVVGNGYKTDSNTRHELYKTIKEQKKCLNLIYYYYYTCSIISPGSVLIKKTAIPRAWKDNILKHNGSDDLYLWMLILSNGAKGTINRDHVYMHMYTGNNTSLDASYMRESTKECVDNLRGKLSDWDLNRIMRRADYYAYSNGTIKDKLKYIDVGFFRFLFGKIL